MLYSAFNKLNVVNGALVSTRTKVMIWMRHTQGLSCSKTSGLKAAPTAHAWQPLWLSMRSWVGTCKQVPRAASSFLFFLFFHTISGLLFVFESVVQARPPGVI